MMSLSGKTALITGASRGIGKAIALTLAKQGMNLALVSRTQSALEETSRQCSELGAKILTLTEDIQDLSRLSSIVSKTLETLGRLDVLVNNAGVGKKVSVTEAKLEDWDRILDVNLRATLHLTRHAISAIQENPWGAIINIASVMGKMTHAGSSAYCASKHGVVGFSGALFEDVREKNIKVCSICPGFVNTEMVTYRGLNSEKMIQPQDIADTVLFVLQFPQTGCPTEILVRPQRSPYLND